MNPSLRIIFAGTPDFAVPALAALITAGHQIVLVLTQPDRPAGRGMKLKASPVKELALQHGIAVFQPETLKSAEVQARIAEAQADVMIVAAYGLIIPASVLAMPRHGCYNIHASLLPRWRGAAPIQRAMLAGDTEIGVTIMEVVLALDAGAMVMHGVVAITEVDTAQTLHDALAETGAALMVTAMQRLTSDGVLPATQQDEALVTYAAKLQKAEAGIDWNKSAAEISRQIRAFNPFPVAHAQWQGETCRLWMATALPYQQDAHNTLSPGSITQIGDSIVVSCGEGFLSITELQMPGGKRLSTRDFLRGHALQVGQHFL